MWTRRSFFLSAMPCVGAAVVGTRSGFCAEQETTFETKMISSGDNFPTVNMRTNRLTSISVALHRQKAAASIESDLGISPAEFQTRIDSLVKAELVKKTPSGRFLPTFLVVTMEDAKWMKPSEKVVEATGRLIADKVPAIRGRAEKIPAIRRAGFSQNAFLILSDVLLDNWQIGNVEDEFLKAERPLRDGRRYYYAVFEKPASQKSEAFGIYGNAGFGLGKVQFGMYGNRRYDGSTLFSTSKDDLVKLFEFPPQADLQAELAKVFERLVAFARTGEDHLTARQKEALSKFGVLENGQLSVTLFSGTENEELGEVAALVKPGLLGLLEGHRAELQSLYARSPYTEEVTFNEFFLWWYHFYYSATTDWLAREGLLTVPPSGNVTYLVAD